MVETLVLPDAARVTTRIATRATLAAQQCTQMPQNGDERPFPPICVHSCVPTVARATGASGDSRNSVHCHSAVNVWWWNVRARVAVQFTLPLGGERVGVKRSGPSGSVIGTLKVGSVRSGPSGSATHTRPHAWGRVAVQLTLPNGIERTKAVRSGPSGSAIGTLGVEWQCHPHEAARLGPSGSAAYTAKWHRAYQSGTLRPEWQCDRYARGRVAVPPTRGRTLGAEWQCSLHCQMASSVPKRYAQARVAVRSVRSGSSGSATHTRPHAWGRVAVQLTLPNGIERTEAVCSGSSGSAIGTLRGEWQYSLHCHSAVNVWWWNVQARVAV